MIDSISINENLWIRLQPHQINFRVEGLSKDVHFTIAFNQKSKYINLHLSKNVKGIDFKNKPKIYICFLPKEDFNLSLPNIGMMILNSMLKKIDLNSDRFADSYIIPFKELEDEKNTRIIGGILKDGFEPISSIKKKKKLSIKGNVKKSFSEVVEAKELEDITLTYLKSFDPKDFENNTGGFLINKNSSSLGVIKINEEWFELDFQTNPFSYLELIVGKELAKIFIDYTKSSIKNIELAKNREECKAYENPIELYIAE